MSAPTNRLLRQRLLLAGVVVSILVSAASSLPGLPPAMVIAFVASSVLVGVPAAYLQFNSGGAFERAFGPTDLLPTAAQELRLDIPRREHGKGKAPTITLLIRREPPATGFEEADTDMHITEDGDVSLMFGVQSTTTLEGKVLIS